MENGTRQTKLHHSLITVIALVAFIFPCVVLWGVDPQIPLLLGCAVGCLVAKAIGYRWEEISNGIISGIHNALEALLILLLIGSLVGVWISCGTVPTIIYYGLKIISARYFLPAAFIVCALISLAIGSWGTIGTIGLGFMGIGMALELPAGLVAGAVLSGAYVGEVISPLSDATNLVAAVVSRDVFKLARSMAKVVVPVVVVTVAAFYLLGLPYTSAGSDAVEKSIEPLLEALQGMFVISPAALLPLMAVLVAVLLRLPAIPAMFIGSVAGILQGVLLQHQPLPALLQSCFSGFVSETGNASLDTLLTAGGLDSMMYSVSMIMIAMGFGGMMQATGQMDALVRPLMRHVKSKTGLVVLTTVTCVGVNGLLPDQYLALSLPGQMYQPEYERRGIDPVLLGNVLSAGGATTSCMIPWNTCGTYAAGILGVTALSYGKYCLLGFLMPLGMIVYAAIAGIREKRRAKKEQTV